MRISLPTQATACAALACVIVTLGLTPSPAQRNPAPRVRIDAYGYVRWNGAQIDPSRGTQKFRFRLNAANGGQTTGGFAIQEPGWLTGKVYRMDVDAASTRKPAAGKPANSSGPVRAKVFAECESGGKKYRVEFDVVGDHFPPAAQPGTHVKSVPGTVRVRLIGPLGPAGSATAPVQVATSVEGTRVRCGVRWPDSQGGASSPRGGAVRAPTGP